MFYNVAKFYKKIKRIIKAMREWRNIIFKVNKNIQRAVLPTLRYIYFKGENPEGQNYF